MPNHKNLENSRKYKNDEFYTQYDDIEKELNSYIEYNKDVFKNKTILCPCDDPEWSNFTKYFAANFERLGLKKLISTSYTKSAGSKQLSLFEENSENYDPVKNNTHGKVFVLDRDRNHSGHIDINDINFSYLEGNGSFDSEEVTKLRDEADFIITNPPFSLFSEFFSWIMEAHKKFLIIGNISCISYKDVFLNIKKNKVWLGTGMGRWISGFIVPKDYKLYGSEAKINDKGERIVSTNSCLWLTNIEHGKKHKKLQLMSMEDNLKYNKKLLKRLDSKYGIKKYPHYDNYDAIEVPYTEAIPKDYTGVMGVPVSFLDKYNPDQFEIIDINPHFFSIVENGNPKPKQLTLKNVNGKDPYVRLLIKAKE